jgi:hypothetical protein
MREARKGSIQALILWWVPEEKPVPADFQGC